MVGKGVKYVGRKAHGGSCIGNVEGNKREVEKLEKEVRDLLNG